ncbi:hypothetical protein NAEGRDRAFT_78535 [Naegleria gruberi]|uniref:CUE domain-containing protein n=1 Tax=Naegleria gruberi TaxID=5762 RepID=D2V4G3_NAEGR|nr:uncharacterized protein NAEGRDRAFT_78535 [Naegleria gruberi]EFC48381.1 hypothetical protein NAEGRDRAFT_78535 [Naegleria gruberi]|eukprot:XP_002681125.1 hypothetical protein NAEGRDRAFT_78535 [Naegleria gruberi strain NEG-M]
MVTPKLTLREAMVTLTTMFPSFDEETIKGVLYQTNGHMERTIEVLLTMVDEGDTGATTNQPPMVSTTNTNTVNNQSGPPPSSGNIVRHTLDEDFLRYSNLDPATGATTQEEENQYSQDEYYAQRLQQALFEQGLSNAPPQTHQPPAYEYGVDNSSPQYHTNSTATVRRNVDSGYSTRGIGSNTTTETSTFDQLSDLAKKKFADFKKKYFTNNNRNNAQPVADPEEETMNRGLLRDEDEEMENSRL